MEQVVTRAIPVNSQDHPKTHISMKPKRIWANFGVENVERTQAFYQKLGFQLNGTPSQELVSFFFGEDKFIIHFFEKQRLKTAMEGELIDSRQGNEIIFSLWVDTKTEYDAWVEEIKKAGGSVLFDSNADRRAFYDENGYFVCVFADPDGHKFNLLYGENM